MEISERNLQSVRVMLNALKPAWGETIITNPLAPLPRALKHAVGLSMTEGMILALRGDGGEELQRSCAFEIWNALPDDKMIHMFPGFGVICEILEEEQEALFVKEMEQTEEERGSLEALEGTLKPAGDESLLQPDSDPLPEISDLLRETKETLPLQIEKWGDTIAVRFGSCRVLQTGTGEIYGVLKGGEMSEKEKATKRKVMEFFEGRRERAKGDSRQ